MLEGGTESELLEAEKVRLVRCPKCCKVLPEFAGLSIYQCGGCKTTLQAKHSQFAGSSCTEKLNTREMLSFEDTRIPNKEDGKQKNDASFAENGALASEGLKGSPISITMSNSNERGEDSPSRLIKEGRHSDSSPFDDQGMGRVDVTTKAIVPVAIYKDSDVSTQPTDEPNYARTKKEILGTESWKYGDNGGHHSSTIHSKSHHPIFKGKIKADAKLDGMERRLSRRDEIRDFRTRPRRSSRVPSHGYHPHLDENPSSYESNSRFDNHVYRKSGFPDSVEHPQVDEDEILRKLDELRDEILRCKVAQAKTEDRSPKNRKVRPKAAYEAGGLIDWIPEGRYSSRSHFLQPFPSVNEHKMIPNSYHQTSPAREGIFMHYDGQASHLRISHKYSNMKMHQKSNLSAHGHFDPVPGTSQTHDVFHNHPACSCEHCINSYRVSYNKRAPYLAGTHSKLSNSESYTGNRTNSSGHSHGIWHDLKSDNSMRNRLTCRCFAGGAPYIICNHCFELLKLPYDFLWKGNKGKLRCGECSQILIVMVNEKRLRVIESASVNGMADGLKHQIFRKDEALESTNHEPISTTSRKDEALEHQIFRKDENIPGAGQGVGISTPISTTSNVTGERGLSPELNKVEIEGGIPSSSGTFKDGSPEVLIDQKDISEAKDVPRHEAVEEPHDHDSSDGDYPESPPSARGVIKYVFGNIAELSKQDTNLSPVNDNYRHIPMKYVSPSVMDLELPPDEYPNLDMSMDSHDGRKEYQGYMFGRDEYSSENRQEPKDRLPTQSLDNTRYKVSINGHPISDRNIKKAIKKAGPIQSGDYWYDYRAGFWGIMGHSCLGIIPPSIKEFNSPMPENCAGGDTGVIVNGRELHRKDLELLASRGLPPSRGRSYIIDISGKVEDAISGEELGNLGKLAPTVEKLGRGFGMRAPRVKHDSS